MAGTLPPRGALVNEALLGVLEIAWEGQAPDVVAQLRHNTKSLPFDEKERLLSELVQFEQVSSLLTQAATGRLAASGMVLEMERWQTAMVARALEPLSDLAGVPKGRALVDTLPDTLKAEVLLRAIKNGPK